ncbi:SecDF P1 head subdomain-containing protein [Nonomuraea jiangxiensis]|uniref:SecDF P1 head subdomain-containing protein n=1 Tax=Nonomuraea jiangxiensis TaxID=633440 RepID=UPI00115FD1AA|nr:hypothetical protein [Nonomuraea jiangxiensis]
MAVVAGSVLLLALLVTVVVAFVMQGEREGSLELRPVLEASAPPCANGALAAADGRTCYQLADGMTVRQVVEAEAELPAGRQEWVVRVRLNEADAATYRGLTAEVYSHTPPRNQLAIVMGDQVLSTVMYLGPVKGDQFEIGGTVTQQKATELAHRIGGRPDS